MPEKKATLIIHSAAELLTCAGDGGAPRKGKAQAALALDRFTPVYSVLMDLPIHRFIPRESKLNSWGGRGVIIKD